MYADGALAESAIAESIVTVAPIIPEVVTETKQLVFCIELNLISTPGGAVQAAPSAMAISDTYQVSEGAVAAQLDCLANDSGLSGRTIMIVTQPGRGTAAVINNGTATAKVTWTDTGSGSGSTAFSYSVDGSNPAVVSLSIEPMPEALIPFFVAAGTADSRSDTANAITPAYPAGLENGDQLLAVFAIDDRGATPGFGAVPAGWADVSTSTHGELAVRIVKKLAAGTELPTDTISQAWTSGDAANDVAVGRVLAFRNAADVIDGLATPLTQGTGSVNMPGVTTTNTNSLALAFIAATSVAGNIGNPSGETGGDWGITSNGAGSSAGDDVGVEFCSAEIPAIGTISGGTVTITAGPTTQKSIIVGLALRGGDAVIGKFISTTGNDANDGSFASPWLTLSHAQNNISAGETLWLRGGRYQVPIGGLSWFKSGTLGNEITVSSYPGEVAVLDGNYPEFQAIGNSQWELHDAATETYRSVGFEYPAGAEWIGNFETGGKLYRLPQYLNLTWLMSTEYTWKSTGIYYRGPGICRHTDGRIYIRLQNLASPRDGGVPAEWTVTPLGDPKNTPPTSGGFDPADFKVNLSQVADAIPLSGSNVKFRRLAFHGGDRGLVMGNVSNLTFENCEVFGQRILFRFNADVSGVNILACDCDNGIPPWMTWNEVKTDATNNPGLKMSFATTDENLADILVQDCRIRSAFDGMAGIRSSAGNIKFLYNTWDFLFDDLIQWDNNATNIEVGWNYIFGPCAGYNGGQPGDSTGSHWFHHNIIDTRRDEFGWRLGAENNNGGGTAWRRSHVAFPAHSADGINVAKIYNNTILCETNINNEGARIERLGTGAGTHEAYNNIVLQYDDREYVRGVSASGQVLDYQLYYKYHAGSTIQRFNDWPDGSGGEADYNSLAAWQASAGFTETQSGYAPGFEANAKEIDPQLGDADAGDYRPLNAAAATGAKDLSSTSWPGATSATYFGAVDPAAATGLGAVGAVGPIGP